jgi:hypothetical protein
MASALFDLPAGAVIVWAIALIGMVASGLVRALRA